MSHDILTGETMPTEQRREQPKDLERDKRETLHAVIGEQLLYTLGSPGDLLKVQVRPLWGNRFRANVYVGVDAAAAKLAHSFFLEADGDGNILASVPKITRLY
jgi:hypothetical protein